MLAMKISFLDSDALAFEKSLLVDSSTSSDAISARVGVVVGGRDFLRIDLAETFEYTCFQAVRMLGNKAFIGFGERLFVVDIITEHVVLYKMAGYFCDLFDTEDFEYAGSDFSILASSASELLAFDQDGTLLWKTEELGIDGVIVHKVSSTGIEGDGEWDPSGGWEPFVLSSRTGERISGGIAPKW
ncbi:hypothetical protein [Massilia sp. erpn]|uniref:hypothetical protein n=1 Tax=Massilia sp. erpn TaxID=2738142 RepID=UPI0021025652|nr:hypothetical protein [Massilia sp. erpn]UTY57189.1 hypothetical protein HPQ68_08280 [Massilia sp. erpn]